MSEKILVVGPAGGREHALLHSLQGENRELFVSGGNAGTDEIAHNVSRSNRWTNSTRGIRLLANWALDNQIDFTVVGPDNALAAGVVDEFQARRLPIFGPTRSAARLESSKAWSGDFVKQYLEEGYYADTVSFSDADQARKFFRSHGPEEYVVKDDGLAYGKGVEVDPAKGKAKMNQIIRARSTVVFQERLEGPELSVFAICDGEHSVLLPTFRDYKRVADGNTGPNTGGMGAYGPVTEISKRFLDKIRDKIVTPTLEGMQKEKAPFKGVMYVGLMLTDSGPKVIEYNVRFGDPEYQATALLLDEDLLEILRQTSAGKLTDRFAKVKRGAAMTVALTAKGYPGANYQKGRIVHGLDDLPKDVMAFHGGTSRDTSGNVLTNGGRVIHLATRAPNIEKAREKLYGSATKPGVIGKHAVHFAGMQYRSDIASTR